MTDKAAAAVAPEIGSPNAPAAAAAAPELVEVDIGGQKFKLDKATAEALNKANEAAAAGKVASERSLQELRDQLARVQPAPAKPAAEQVDIGKLIFTDPEKAFDLMRDQIVSAVRAENQQRADQQAFWTEFYSQNEDLKDLDWVVKAVMQRDFNALKPLQISEAIPKLASAVKAEVLKVTKRAPKGDQHKDDDSNTELEGGTERTPRKPKGGSESSQAADSSISGVLRARAAARQAARMGAKA